MSNRGTLHKPQAHERDATMGRAGIATPKWLGSNGLMELIVDTGGMRTSATAVDLQAVASP